MLNREKYNTYPKFDYCASCAFYLRVIVVSLLSQAVIAFIGAALGEEVSTSGDFNGAFMILIQCVNAAVIALSCVLGKKRLNFNLVKDDGGKIFRAVDILVPLACAALLFVGMYLPTVWFGYLLTAMGVSPTAGELTVDSAFSLTAVVIASVLLAPMFEESIYRGVLLHGLRSKRSAVRSAVLAAASFALMHMSPLQLVFQFALGLICGFSALRSQKLLPAILLHAASNALALVVGFTPLDGVIDGCVAWLCDNVAAALLITLGLFVGAGAAIFALVHFVLRAGGEREKPRQTPQSVDLADVPVTPENAERINATQRERDGKFKYLIGMGICVVMVIVNLLALIFAV